MIRVERKKSPFQYWLIMLFLLAILLFLLLDFAPTVSEDWRELFQGHSSGSDPI